PLTEFFKDFVQLFFKDGGGEGLDHIAVGTGLGSSNDVFLLGLGRYHEHRQLGKRRVGTDLLQHGQAVEVGHVPVGHHELERATAQLVEGHGAVFGFVDVFETEILEQVLDNATHGGEVIHHQNLHGFLYHVVGLQID